MKNNLGYILTEIAFMIKDNGIVISDNGLLALAKSWQRFNIINDDLVGYLRDYCKKHNKPFLINFYLSPYVSSLAKERNF